jgi:hypothetical protein
MEDAMKILLGVSCVLVVLAGVMMASASPPTGVTPLVLSRGTYEPFKVKTDHDSPVDFEAKGKSELDIVVRQHSYAPRASTGWHTHPGPVFITVVQGTLAFYEYDDPTCTPKIVTAGQGYVDTGHGHIGINPTDQSALDISVILAPPAGAPFRGELPAPNPYCGF